ncbi:MAG: hypothetical protein DRH57_06170 [Candidatus Cloacimonadota bacterium]|nr:MAG: hypothetical protein DRH57_06170 [Candidatus Cloacimonadota bacterium]
MKSKVYFIDFTTSFSYTIFDKLKCIAERSHLTDIFAVKDNVAVKLHFGEYGNFGNVNARYVRFFIDLIKSSGARPFLTDTNTLYTGERSNSVDHLNNAVRNGYDYSVVNAPIIIADGLYGMSEIELESNSSFTEFAYIASDIYYADAMLVISHTTGHEVTGYGGALKNVGMGCASRKGKMDMHSTSAPIVKEKKCTGCAKCVKWCPVNAIQIINKKAKINKDLCIGCSECISVCPFKAIGIEWNQASDIINAKIVDYAYACLKNKQNKVFYVNFLNNITNLCDCTPIHGIKEIPDIGILFSSDIVSIDKASLDLINESAGYNLFQKLHPKANVEKQLIYAEKLGLGCIEYEIIKVN